MSEVVRTIEEEWEVDSVNDVLSSIAPEPIASASIAQVHEATVRLSGERIALKVQHRGVAAIIEQDLENAAYLVSYLAREKCEYIIRCDQLLA